jgi:WD40 repeat protein
MGAAPGKIYIWDVNSSSMRTEFQPIDHRVYCMEHSPDGRYLVSGHVGSDVNVWEAATGRRVTTLTGHKSRIHNLAFSPDGRTLASGSADKTIKLWDFAAVIPR